MIDKALTHIHPGAEFVLVGIPSTATEYANALTWLDQRPKPTWKQVSDALAAMDAEAAAKLAQREAVIAALAAAAGLGVDEVKAALG